MTKESTSEEFVLDWDDFAPRCPEERMRLYRTKDGGAPELVATCADEAAVGVALYWLGKEGEFLDYSVGWLDTHGTDEEPGDWILKPWVAKPVPEVKGFTKPRKEKS